MISAQRSKTFTLRDLDIFFISYDEPNAEANWQHLYSIAKTAKRFHGVTGFDKAHKLCAQASTTQRFVIVDGDNWINEPVLKYNIDDTGYENVCFSFKSKNAINGLEYGNGGIKVWDKDTLLQSNTHEQSDTTDFCWDIPYYQIDVMSGTTVQNNTPYQAWRAGYREGVKMTYVNGVPPDNWATHRKDIWRGNLSKLSIWCAVGRDVENGIWAMLGARHGLCDMLDKTIKNTDINNYAWFADKWNSIKDCNLELTVAQFAARLKSLYDFAIPELDSDLSIWFKNTYMNPTRHGLMK